MYAHFFEFDANTRRLLTRILENFMQVMGILLLIIGISRAMIILGMVADPAASFINLPRAQQTALIFFTIFNLTAAVGLWNKMSWGAIVWLITVGVDFTLQLFFSNSFGISPITLTFHLITVSIYIIFVLLIRRAKVV